MKKITRVVALENYELNLEFDSNEIRIFDVKPYLDRGVFTQLKDIAYFQQVRLFLDSITWPNGQDFDPDHLYLESHYTIPHLNLIS